MATYCFQVRDVWQSYELELVNYQNKCRIIRGWDDLFTKVKEHINSVSAMKLSPYYKVTNNVMKLSSEALCLCLESVRQSLVKFSNGGKPIYDHGLCASFVVQN